MAWSLAGCCVWVFQPSPKFPREGKVQKLVAAKYLCRPSPLQSTHVHSKEVVQRVFPVWGGALLFLCCISLSDSFQTFLGLARKRLFKRNFVLLRFSSNTLSNFFLAAARSP